MSAAQATAVRVFEMGAGAQALWMDAYTIEMRVRRHDTRTVVRSPGRGRLDRVRLRDENVLAVRTAD